MATQNPIEQEGTYPLPEAQLDRFLMHVRVGYPDAAGEQKILQLVREQARTNRRAAGADDPGHAGDASSPRATKSSICTWRRRWRNTSCNSSLARATRAVTTPQLAAGCIRRQPARHDRPRPLRARPRLAARSRLRVARRHPRHRARCAAPPRPARRIEAEAEGVDARISSSARLLRHIAVP